MDRFDPPPEIAWKIAMDLPIMRRTLVLLAAATGMRISGLLGLQSGDIEWDAQIIHMNRTWLYGYVGEGKTEESREPVPIGKRVTEFLREWHCETPYAAGTDWVFPSFKLKGKKPISGSQFVKDYIRPRFLAILLHASSDITMDIYTHAQDEEKRDAVKRYESRLVQ